MIASIFMGLAAICFSALFFMPLSSKDQILRPWKRWAYGVIAIFGWTTVIL